MTARIHNRLSFCRIFLISVQCTLGDIGFQSFLISEFKNGYQLKYIIFAIVGALIFLVITILLIQNIWTRQKVEEFTFCIYIITILIHSAASILFIIKLYPDYFVYNIFLFIISLNSVGIMTILIIVYFGVSVMLIIVEAFIKWLCKKLGKKDERDFMKYYSFFYKRDNAEKDSCIICLNEFVKNDIVCITNCQSLSHVFHEECILSWMINNNTCPICRDTIKFK